MEKDSFAHEIYEQIALRKTILGKSTREFRINKNAAVKLRTSVNITESPPSHP